MKNLIHGQSCISPDCPIIGQDGQAVIVEDEKQVYDIDISDMHGLFETREQRHERIERRYNEMLAERELERQCPENTYNLRMYNYPHGQQLTYYTNAVAYHTKHEKLDRSYHNTERTKEERERCINVSLARTKNTIYNIARSHDWKWFITFTFNRQDTDASDFKEIMRKMSKNLDNTKQRKCPNLKYIVVPELHMDKTNYHFHGLFAGCDELQFVFSGKFDKKSGRPIFNVPNWSWGFTTATLVDDSAAASNYICKYITKETEHYLFGQRRYLSNAPKTEAEKYFVWNSKKEVIENCADDIRYMKEIVVNEAHRKITIMELPPDTVEIVHETGDIKSENISEDT